MAVSVAGIVVSVVLLLLRWIDRGTMIQRSCALLRGLEASSSRNLIGSAVGNVVKGAVRRSVSNSGADAVTDEKIIAAVVVERLPVVLPDMASPMDTFESFS